MAESYLIAFVKLGRRPVDSLLPNRERIDDPVNGLINILAGINSGTYEGQVAFSWMDDSGTEPAGEIAVTAANVVSGTTDLGFAFVGGEVTLLAGTDFEVDTSSDAAQAEIVAQAINEHEILKLFLSASADAGTITVTCFFPGNFLENITMSETGTAFALTPIGDTAGVDGDATYFGRGVKKL